MPLDPLNAPKRGPKPQQPYGHSMGRRPLAPSSIRPLRPPLPPPPPPPPLPPPFTNSIKNIIKYYIIRDYVSNFKVI